MSRTADEVQVQAAYRARRNLDYGVAAIVDLWIGDGVAADVACAVIGERRHVGNVWMYLETDFATLANWFPEPIFECYLGRVLLRSDPFWLRLDELPSALPAEPRAKSLPQTKRGDILGVCSVGH